MTILGAKIKIYRKITIPGEVISKKNSPLVIKLGKRYSIRASKRYTEYEKEAKTHLLNIEPLLDVHWPITMHFYFFRATLRSFDYNNLSQGPQDLLQQAGIIPEDDMKHVTPCFSPPYGGWEKDKDSPRVEITITDGV